MRYFLTAAMLVLAIVTAASSQNLIKDGGFEQLAIEEPFLGIPGGWKIGGWYCGGDGVDVVRGYWQAAEGAQSIDLAGVQNGSVYQDISTEPGAMYRLRFAAAPNPDYPGTRALEVRWGLGALVGQVEMDAAGCTREQMGWRYVEFEVMGSGLDTLLILSLWGPDCYGPAIDDVSLTLVPEPSAAASLAAGVAGMCVLRRRRR